MLAWGGTPGVCWQGLKRFVLLAGQKVSSLMLTKCFISFGFLQNDRALDRPRRRRMALGKVVTCPSTSEGLERKPRNRCLIALWCVDASCKIEAVFSRQIMHRESKGFCVK